MVRDAIPGAVRGIGFGRLFQVTDRCAVLFDLPEQLTARPEADDSYLPIVEVVDRVRQHGAMEGCAAGRGRLELSVLTSTHNQVRKTHPGDQRCAIRQRPQIHGPVVSVFAAAEHGAGKGEVRLGPAIVAAFLFDRARGRKLRDGQFGADVNDRAVGLSAKRVARIAGDQVAAVGRPAGRKKLADLRVWGVGHPLPFDIAVGIELARPQIPMRRPITPIQLCSFIGIWTRVDGGNERLCTAAGLRADGAKCRASRQPEQFVLANKGDCHGSSSRG